MIAIRKGNSLDISNILILFQKYLDGANVKEYPEAGDYAGVWIADLILNHVLFVAENIDKQIVGMLGFRISPFPWNNKFFCLAAEIFMVDPEFRQGNAAKEMLEESKKLGEILKMPVMCGVMSGTAAELKDRFTKSCGFKYIGGNFIYGDY